MAPASSYWMLGTMPSKVTVWSVTGWSVMDSPPVGCVGFEPAGQPRPPELPELAGVLGVEAVEPPVLQHHPGAARCRFEADVDLGAAPVDEDEAPARLPHRDPGVLD